MYFYLIQVKLMFHVKNSFYLLPNVGVLSVHLSHLSFGHIFVLYLLCLNSLRSQLVYQS